VKRTATGMTVAAVLAALVAVSATASAAPSTQSAKATPARATPAKITQLTKLSRVDGQYISLSKRVKKCPASAPVLRATAKQRTAALKKARTSSVRVLRAKNKRLSKAVQVLARFESGCTRTGATNVVAASPQTAPGSAPGSVSFNLTAPAALNSPLIDLTPLLRGGVLPGTIQLVSPGQLTSPICAANGAACVAVDPNGLLEALRDLVASVPLIGPIATPLLDEINRLLVGGDLDRLFEVRRISDTVIQLVPEGPLATLAALLGDAVGRATDVVGRIQVV
jgi:hypothetical protein